MTTSSMNRTVKVNIMSNAWAIASNALAIHNVGSKKDYFKESLKQAWNEFKTNVTNFVKVALINRELPKLYSDNSGRFLGAMINEHNKITLSPLGIDTGWKLFGGAFKNINAWVRTNKFPNMTEEFNNMLENFDSTNNINYVYISEAQTKWFSKVCGNGNECYIQEPCQTLSYRLGLTVNGFTKLYRKVTLD